MTAHLDDSGQAGLDADLGRVDASLFGGQISQRSVPGGTLIEIFIPDL